MQFFYSPLLLFAAYGPLLRSPKNEEVSERNTCCKTISSRDRFWERKTCSKPMGSTDMETNTLAITNELITFEIHNISYDISSWQPLYSIYQSLNYLSDAEKLRSNALPGAFLKKKAEECNSFYEYIFLYGLVNQVICHTMACIQCENFKDDQS